MTATRDRDEFAAYLEIALASPDTAKTVWRLVSAVLGSKPVDPATAIWAAEEAAEAGLTPAQQGCLLAFLTKGDSVQ